MTQQAEIAKYIEEHKNAWSPTTARSVRYTLQGVAEHIDGNPDKLWDYLQKHQAPYTRVTTWTRVIKYWSWVLEKGEKSHEDNLYSQFRKRNARSFKHTYERKPSSLSFQEVKSRLSKIEDEAVRKKALELLDTGMRYTESLTLRDGVIVGKGGKRRDVLNMPHVEGPVFDRSYQTFWRHLKTVGLTPHILRKVLANHLAHSDEFNLFDLCDLFGWADPKTARSYVAPKRKNKLKEKMWRATHHDTSGKGIYGSGQGSSR